MCFKKSHTFLCAKEVEVVVRVDRCDWRAQRLCADGQILCDGLCAQVIESSFREVLKWAAQKG
jgi:hypothetical protein